MSLNEGQSTHLVIYAIPTICLACGRPLSQELGADNLELEIRSVTAETDHFELQGTGRFHGFCPRCGQQVRILEDHIPIHCVGLNCKKCGQPDDLKVRVRKLSKEGNQFEFEALLECHRCQRRSRLTKLLGRLSEILSVEIGLTGITLKAKEKKEPGK